MNEVSRSEKTQDLASELAQRIRHELLPLLQGSLYDSGLLSRALRAISSLDEIENGLDQDVGREKRKQRRKANG